MRILLLNPNTSESITELMMNTAVSIASPATEVVPMTAQRGVPYIATRAEAQIGGAVVLEMLAERQSEIDAAIIAAFGDPGLLGARELFDFPVVGLAEAALLTACMLGRRFAVVSFARALEPWYRECIELHGLRDRCAGFTMLDEPFASISEVQGEKEEQLVALANKAISTLEPDSIILAGAPLTGLAEKVAGRIGVPVIDQVAAAVRQAETLVMLRPRKATTGTFKRPVGKPTIGLPAALAERIEGR